MPWLTKIAGPDNVPGRIGVCTTAKPIFDADGQFAGFRLNCASVQAFCSVVNLDGSAFGSSTLTLAIFAYVPCGA